MPAKKNVRPEFTSQAITLEIAKISASTGAHARCSAIEDQYYRSATLPL